MLKCLNRKGFTLIETLVAIAVFALAMGAVSGLIVSLYRTQSFALQQSQAVNEARKGIEQMIKEIREANKGDDGAYIIEKAENYEFIFYSDIDKDEEVERVRYFLKPAGGGSGSLTAQCASFSSGGSCNVSFFDFSSQPLESAQLKVSVEGDLNSGNETVKIFADGIELGTLCSGGDCGQCAEFYQDLTTFDVSSQASDNSIQFTADSSSSVNPFCDWQESNHSLKAKFEFTWQESPSPEAKAIFKKGVIEPAGWPIEYLSQNEEFFIISENIQNEVLEEPLFTYYDSDNNLLGLQDRMEKTARMHLKVIVNIDPERPPQDFRLESDVQIRNLKTNL